jgi:hypothetical protein
MFARYGETIFALNLVKSNEKVVREMKLADEFSQAI